MENLQLKLEALLFSAADWVELDHMIASVEENEKEEVEKALMELEKKYEEGYAFFIEHIESRWKMTLKDEYTELTQHIVFPVNEMPKKTLKVLSYIAYDQPITKTKLRESLGEVMKEIGFLKRTGFIDYTKAGNAKYYRVTKKFHQYFKIDDFTKEVNEIQK